MQQGTAAARPAQEVYTSVPLKRLAASSNLNYLLVQVCRYFADRQRGRAPTAAVVGPMPAAADYERFGLTMQQLQSLVLHSYVAGGRMGSVLWNANCPENILKVHYASTRRTTLELYRELCLSVILSLTPIAEKQPPFALFIHSAHSFGIWTPSAEDAQHVLMQRRKRGAGLNFAGTQTEHVLRGELPHVDVADLLADSAADAHRRNVFTSHEDAPDRQYSPDAYTAVMTRMYSADKQRHSANKPSYLFTASQLVSASSAVKLDCTEPAKTFGAAIAHNHVFTQPRAVCGVFYCLLFMLARLRSELGAEHRDLSAANVVLTPHAFLSAAYRIPIHGSPQQQRFYDAEECSAGLVPIIIDISEMRIDAAVAQQRVAAALQEQKISTTAVPDAARQAAARWIASKSTDAQTPRRRSTYSADVRRLWLHITTILLFSIRERVLTGAPHGAAIRSVSATLFYLCLRFTFVKRDEWHINTKTLRQEERAAVGNFFSYSKVVGALLRLLLHCHVVEPSTVIGRDMLLRSLALARRCIETLLQRLNMVLDLASFDADSFEERFFCCDSVMKWAPLVQLLSGG